MNRLGIKIRKLAEQAKTSASDINDLLKNVQAKSTVVSQTATSVDRELSRQITVIGNSVQSFKGIIADVREIIPRIRAVTSNMEDIEREKGSVIHSIEAATAVAEEVSASSEQIAASAEELSACCQEIAASAHDLNKVAQTMAGEVQRFRIE